jgi:hypothetical protein
LGADESDAASLAAASDAFRRVLVAAEEALREHFDFPHQDVLPDGRVISAAMIAATKDNIEAFVSAGWTKQRVLRTVAGLLVTFRTNITAGRAATAEELAGVDVRRALVALLTEAIEFVSNFFFLTSFYFLERVTCLYTHFI